MVDDAITVALTDTSLGSSTLRPSQRVCAARSRTAACTCAVPSPAGTRRSRRQRGGLPRFSSRRPLSPTPAESRTSARSATPSAPCGRWGDGQPERRRRRARCRSVRYRLAVALSGAVISGNAAPGARILVEQSQGARTDRQTTTASGGGVFSITLRDPAPGDEIAVSAADPATHGVTTQALIVSGLVPRSRRSSMSRPCAAARWRRGGRARRRERALGRRHPRGARRHTVRRSRRARARRAVRITATAQSGPARRTTSTSRRLDRAHGRRRARPDRSR